MNDEHLTALWKEISRIASLTEFDKLTIPTDWESMIYDTSSATVMQDMVTPISHSVALTDIISDMEKIQSDVNKNKYWTERQYNFLKKCCNSNLRQYNIKVVDGQGGIYDFSEVVFENVLPDSLCIIGKCTNYVDMTFTITSEGFQENQYEIPSWVKRLMKQVFENYKVVKNLEK